MCKEYKLVSAAIVLLFGLVISLCLSNSNVYAGSVGDKMYTVPGDPKYYDILQGGGTDGKYAYFISADNTTTKDKCMLIKADMSKSPWETVASIKDTDSAFKNMRLNHGNDLTYDSQKKKLVIVSKREKDVSTDIERASVTIVDPNTLIPEKQIALEKEKNIKIYCISYNAKRNQYIAGKSGGTDFYILDSNFNKVKEYKGRPFPDNGYSYRRQGVDCDDDYIYFLQNPYKKDANGKLTYQENKIMVYDWNGNFIKNVHLNYNKEGEHLFHIGKTFYMGVNLSDGKNEARKIDFRIYKINYNANGGTGSVASNYVEYGMSTPLRDNSFVKSGYSFKGWNAYRASDQKWYYTDGTNTGWYLEGAQPSGYTKTIYKDGASVAKTTSVHRDTVTMYAVWGKFYTVVYNANGGTGSMASTKVEYGVKTALRKNSFTKTGYTFKGWNAYRASDQKWYYTDGTNTGWYKSGSQPSGYTKTIYKDGVSVAKTTSVNKDTVTMYAQWNKK